MTQDTERAVNSGGSVEIVKPEEVQLMRGKPLLVDRSFILQAHWNRKDLKRKDVFATRLGIFAPADTVILKEGNEEQLRKRRPFNPGDITFLPMIVSSRVGDRKVSIGEKYTITVLGKSHGMLRLRIDSDTIPTVSVIDHALDVRDKAEAARYLHHQ